MRFHEKYLKAREERESILCIGLDPALKEQRKHEVIPEKYGDDLLGFCLDIIDKTAEHACAFKINSQYVLFKLTLDELMLLNQVVRDKGCLSILDHKLGDINESNNSAFYWIKKAGFDALTYNPYSGNLRDAADDAHHHDLGLFVLTLMSNPQAEWIQKDAPDDQPPLYERIAREAGRSKADGVVVGTTDHVKNIDLKRIKVASRDETIYLCPGVGKQQGAMGKIFNALGDNLLVNVGRAIIYDQHPGEKANGYRKLFEK
ncbi:MAG: orotidine-5'-phosphate decarboxylase [Candidatus Altiarchaeales archaeon ex4484_2]|nr:MAG: orotidine-5'-phosphate decarboxylase [Candidatus Altiarchaeales archaeon ex4484_2]